MANVYTYLHLLKLPSFIGITVQVYIHYEYNPGQDCEYCNYWESSSPGIAPEIILRGVQPLEIPGYSDLEAWLCKNPEWRDFLRSIILHQVQAELHDEDSALYHALLEFAGGENE